MFNLYLRDNEFREWLDKFEIKSHQCFSRKYKYRFWPIDVKYQYEHTAMNKSHNMVNLSKHREYISNILEKNTPKDSIIIRMTVVDSLEVAKL